MDYPKHVMQSPLWANFRQNWGTKVIHSGNSQFTVHKVPYLPWTIGYMPRPNSKDIDWPDLYKKAQEEKCIFVKIEPNTSDFKPPKGFDVRKGDRIFAYATLIVDLKKSEQELLSNMHITTRYNVNLARRKGVEVKVGQSEKMFREFMHIYHETAKRHKILTHPDNYYKKLFDTFKNEDKGFIITGYLNHTPLASMMLIAYENTVFYPYGGSIPLYRETKPFYLVMWEAFLHAKSKGYDYFDMWNCLTPETEDPGHPWFGFHQFKKGFRGELVRYCGAYDLVIIPNLYTPFILISRLRLALLKIPLYLKKMKIKKLISVKLKGNPLPVGG